MPVLMDDILVMMDQVYLTRPACIFLIFATSEVYTLPRHFFLPPNGVACRGEWGGCSWQQVHWATM
jgi:hypothetical protein